MHHRHQRARSSPRGPRAGSRCGRRRCRPHPARARPACARGSPRRSTRPPPRSSTGTPAGRLHDAVVLGEIVGGVGLDDVGAELDRLADEAMMRSTSSARLCSRLRRRPRTQRLDHQRHPRARRTRRAGRRCPSTQSPRRPSPAGDVEEVDDDAGGVEPDGVPDGFRRSARPRVLRQPRRRRCSRVGAQDERGPVAAGVAWSRSAWPTESWIASGPASASTSTASPMSSIPARNDASPKNPWSTATSKHRPDRGSNSRDMRMATSDTWPPAARSSR